MQVLHVFLDLAVSRAFKYISCRNLYIIRLYRQQEMAFLVGNGYNSLLFHIILCISDLEVFLSLEFKCSD